MAALLAYPQGASRAAQEYQNVPGTGNGSLSTGKTLLSQRSAGDSFYKAARTRARPPGNPGDSPDPSGYALILATPLPLEIPASSAGQSGAGCSSAGDRSLIRRCTPLSKPESTIPRRTRTKPSILVSPGCNGFGLCHVSLTDRAGIDYPPSYESPSRLSMLPAGK